VIKRVIATKVGSALVVAAVVASVGGVATASAHHDDGHGHGHHRIGYALDQCKDGGWKKFKNPDGSQKFKNQGQCIVFFVLGGRHHGPGNGGDSHDTNIDVDAHVDQNVHSGDVKGNHSSSGDAAASASTSVNVTTSPTP
jgi:hypothetical protein